MPADDISVIRIPNLQENPNNLPIILAAMNGCLEEKDEILDISTGQKINCLKKLLLEERFKTPELRQFLIVFLLHFEKTKKMSIPRRYQVIKYLIEQGFNANEILLASYCDSRADSDDVKLKLNLEVLQAALEGGAEPDLNRNGYSMLHAAVVTQSLDWKERIDLLLSRGINPNLTDSDRGYGTALHLALANEGFDDTDSYVRAKYLIKKLCGTEFNWNTPDKEEKTILIIAAKMRATSVLKLLMEQKKEHGLSIDLDKQDNHGRTALHYCCALGNLVGVQLLREHGASMKIADKEGKLPVDYCKLPAGDVTAILSAIHIDSSRDEGALTNHILDLSFQRICSRGSRGEKVFYVSKKENLFVLKGLMRQFESQEFSTEEEKEYITNFIEIQFQYTGRTLLTACMSGQREVLVFLEQGPDVRSTESTHVLYDPSLDILVSKTRKYLEKDPKAKPFLTSIQERAFSKALRQACAAGAIELVDALCQYLERTEKPIVNYINETSGNKRTSLHWAALSGNRSILDKLLTYHPDTTLRDQDNKLYSDCLDLKPTLLGAHLKA